MSILTKGLAKIFGNKSERDIKEVAPIVKEINNEYAKLAFISDDELRGKTSEFKSIIAEDLREIDEQIAALHQRIEDEPNLDLNEKDSIFQNIDKLEENRNESLEVTLKRILPQAFAVVKETARRFK